MTHSEPECIGVNESPEVRMPLARLPSAHGMRAEAEISKQYMRSVCVCVGIIFDREYAASTIRIDAGEAVASFLHFLLRTGSHVLNSKTSSPQVTASYWFLLISSVILSSRRCLSSFLLLAFSFFGLSHSNLLSLPSLCCH